MKEAVLNIDDIKKVNKDLNAFISFAVNSQRKMVSGGALKGLTFAAKDNLMVEGVGTTCGSKILENYEAPYTATAVQRILDAGAVLIGKTNMDEFAMGSSNEYSYFGPVRNPHDKERVAGGSSGGSAAAVAAGLVDFALGSDTGGSVRQPASFCGVIGFKPSYGAISRYGLVSLSSSLDQIGIFASDIGTVEKVFKTLYGADGLDATSVDKKVFKKPVRRGLTIGVVKEFMGKEVQPEVRMQVEKAIETLQKQRGVKVKTVSLSDLEAMLAAYYIVQPAEASSNLSRFDGLRYGSYVRGKSDRLFDEQIEVNRSEGFGPEVKRRIMVGNFVLSSGYIDAYYNRAEALRDQLRRKFASLFSEVNILLGPTVPNTAFKIGEFSHDPVAMYYQDLMTLPANLAGIPAISLPVGMDSQGLPIGLQLMAAEFDDLNLLADSKKITTWLGY